MSSTLTAVVAYGKGIYLRGRGEFKRHVNLVREFFCNEKRKKMENKRGRESVSVR